MFSGKNKLVLNKECVKQAIELWLGEQFAEGKVPKVEDVYLIEAQGAELNFGDLGVKIFGQEHKLLTPVMVVEE